MYRIVFWTLWERVRVGWYGRMALKHVNYHMWNESPVQVWCISILYWCFSFWLTSLCIIGSSFIHFIRTDSNAFFFNSSVILHCTYVPQLAYPFACWWTSRLLPWPGYCKQCCDEYWGTHVSFNAGFLGVYAQQWDCWVIWQFYFQFLKESPRCSP